MLEKYIKDIIGAFKDDLRILAWDLYNEPSNSGRGDRSKSLLEAAYKWARELDPSQPLTVGIWSWVDTLNGVETVALGLSDVVSFHNYGNIGQTERQIEKLRSYNRPMLCTEWLHRPNGNMVNTHLPLFKCEKIGIYNWGLVVGKTQTNLNWSTMVGEPDENPAIWQQDLYHADHTPYDAAEIELLRTFINN